VTCSQLALTLIAWPDMTYAALMFSAFSAGLLIMAIYHHIRWSRGINWQKDRESVE